MKAVVAAFNQEKALVGAFSVITNLRMELFQALAATRQQPGSSRRRLNVQVVLQVFAARLSAESAAAAALQCCSARSVWSAGIMPSNINYKVFSAQQHSHQRQHQFGDPRRCQSQPVCQLQRAEHCANITLQILSNIQFMHPQIPRTGWWPTRKMEENARKTPAGAGLGGNIQTCAE